MKNHLILLITILIGINTSLYTQSNFRSGVFLHHSTGANIWGPNGSSTSIPQQMTIYNTTKGYTDSTAVSMNEVWFPGSGADNDWYNWHWIFDNLDPNNNIYPFLAANKIVVIKSCFPSSNITGYGSPADTSGSGVTYKTIYNYKWHWRSILNIMKQHPENFFVIWTNAPLVAEATNSTEARLAKEFCTWAKDTLANGNDPVYGAFPPNVYVFDFFHKLAMQNGYMNPAYQVQSGDSHPNAAATELVAPQFVQEVFDAAIAYESFAGGTSFQLTIPIQNGWNLISVPGLHPVDQGVNTWWSGRDPSANIFKFWGNYQPVTSLSPGSGYWMQHIGDNIYNTGDEWPASGINVVPHNAIPGVSGWNLIGGYENNLPTAGLTTTPGGLITGSVYNYTPSGGYQAATSLVPGMGYWVVLSGSGTINFPNTADKRVQGTEYIKEDMGKIIITDAVGKSYKLYTVNGVSNMKNYELPPAPFADMFDVRFGSGRYAENLSTGSQSIEMQGMEYPIKVRAENTNIRLKNGKELNAILNSGEELIIMDKMINKLFVSEDFIPGEYSLGQNYPNPFNPSTSIKYQVSSSSQVTLKVYDVLGNEVATLVNEYRDAGSYEVDFQSTDGSRQLASGVYFYQLQAVYSESGSARVFVETRKMIILQ